MKKNIQQHSSAIQTTCRLFKMAPLALAVSLASMVVAPMAQATDLDIYKANTISGSEATVMMVFDVSRNMLSPDNPDNVGLERDSEAFIIREKLPAGVNPNTISGYTSEFGSNDKAYDFDRYYYRGVNGKFYYRRIDKVKMSLYHILDIQKMEGVDSKPLSPGLGFGLTLTPNFDYEYTPSGLTRGYEESKGYILVPAYPLDYKYPGTKKPIGVHKRDQIRYANSPVPDPENVYAGWTHKERLHDAIRYIDADNAGKRGRFTPLAMAYLESASYLLGTRTNQPGGDSTYSGTDLSASDTKGSDGIYKSPSQCGGAQGIFMLGSGPGFLPKEVNKLGNFKPLVQKVIDPNYRTGNGKDKFINCGTLESGRAFVGYDHDMKSDNRIVGSDGRYWRAPTTVDQQWTCPLFLTRSLRGLNYSRNFDFRFDRSSRLFGDDYKEVGTLKEKNLKILTGAIGFGKYMGIMAEFPKITRYTHKGEPVQAIDCSAMRANVDLRPSGTQEPFQAFESFCTFAAETYNYGEGGIYMGTEPGQVSEALNSFISKIPRTPPKREPMSTGTMSVPFDSLNQLTPRTSAYLPILDPKVDTEELWPGNLKKYTIKNGTIVGKTDTGEDKKVFTSRQGFFAKDIKDEWNTNSSSDEAKSQVGGAYQQILKGVTSTETRNRKTYIDVGNGLKSISVEAGNPSGFTSLKDAWSNESSINQIAQDSTQQATLKASSDKATDIAKRVQEMMRQLVNFLGYPADSTTTVSDGSALTKLDGDGKPKKIQQTRDNRVLGGVLHSRPQLVTYDAVLNKNGSVASRKDYLLYGSFDGALHMVDDDTGEELFNFIPRQVLQRQGKAFSPSTNQGLGDPTEAPYLHGVDGEWKVFGDYRRKVTGKDTYGIKADSMFAVGGLRMGGSTYYALDITNKDTPKLLYSVGSDYALGIGKGSFTASGEKNSSSYSAYSRMGLSWGKPNVAYVKKGGERVMVSLLPGGYDECYEDPHFELGSAVTTNSISGCNGKASAQGNAIYMVKLAEEEKVNGVSKWKTDGITGIGDALWWASSNAPSSGATSMQIPDMKHSIVNEILALDGNYDGLTDHLYFSDLGGQVWRVDINNDMNDKENDDFSIQRVVKVFDASSDAENIIKGSGDSTVTYKYSPRMYDTPLVTFQRLGKEGKIHGVVTVGTGDRSNPLDTEFSNNHIYTFIDRDLARYRNELFCEKTTGSTDDCMTRYTEGLTPNDLINISYDSDGAAKDGARVKAAIDRGISGETSDDGIVAKAGWKYKLDDSGFTAKLNEGKQPDEAMKKPKGLKMLNRPDALSGQLYTTIFSPEFTAQESEDACAMSIAGLTNRERLCLPYGYCFTKDTDGSSKTVNRSTVVAGGGIVDNYVGYLGQGKTDEKGRPVKTIGILDTYCEGDECERSTEIDELGKLSEFDVNRSFNPLKWFDR